MTPTGRVADDSDAMNAVEKPQRSAVRAAPTANPAFIGGVHRTEGAVLFLPPDVPARPGIFALVMDGDCMAPRIEDGDFVVGRRAEPPAVGEPAIVKIRGFVPTTKCWRPAEGDIVRLVPTNPKHKTIRVRRSEICWACRVLAVVRKEPAAAGV